MQAPRGAQRAWSCRRADSPIQRVRRQFTEGSPVDGCKAPEVTETTIERDGRDLRRRGGAVEQLARSRQSTRVDELHGRLCPRREYRLLHGTGAHACHTTQALERQVLSEVGIDPLLPF